jgi:uncharacterized Fe-S radical SAM superfamily protein PflX
MLKLQDEGICHNINFVTPEHCAPQVSTHRALCPASLPAAGITPCLVRTCEQSRLSPHATSAATSQPLCSIIQRSQNESTCSVRHHVFTERATVCVLHYLAPSLQVAEAIAAAVERGLTIPIIYNTSSYDALSSLALMDGLVDIVGLSLMCGENI